MSYLKTLRLKQTVDFVGKSVKYSVIVPHVLSVTTASRRRVLRGLASAASVLALGGCAGLASGGPRFDASAISLNPTLLVATTRKPVDGAPHQAVVRAGACVVR